MGTESTAAGGGRRPPLQRARPGVPYQPRRRRARLIWAVIALLVITVAAIGWWLGSGRWTTVPQVSGQQESTAIGLLQAAGLNPSCCDRQFSESVPQGQVLSAKPGPGRAIRGTGVRLLVSKGPERFQVNPGLVGQPKDAVLAALKTLPVTAKVTESYDEKVAAGSVAGFDPPAGTALKRDQTVTVIVSKGRQPVTIPNVVGSTPEAATSALQQLGFKVTRAPDGRSATVQAGQVMTVAPDPAAGPVSYGSTVTITVSAGVPQVQVPDVRGKKADEATQILQQAGLKVDTTNFFGSKVREQTPAPGTTVDQGSTVKILVSF